MNQQEYEKFMKRVEKARCPECGDRVFVPARGWQKYYGGTPENPVVICRDMGHWIGTIDECKEV